MKEYKVKEDLLNATLQYLGSKPYVEVAGLLAALKQAEEVKEEKTDAKKEA